MVYFGSDKHSKNVEDVPSPQTDLLFIVLCKTICLGSVQGSRMKDVI